MRYFLISLFFTISLNAQDTLRFQDYIDFVLSEHPYADLADIEKLRAEAESYGLLGVYDPKLEGTLNSKNYSDTEYFTLGDANLSVQTPFALKFKGGVEYSAGNFINRQNTLPEQGLSYIGAELPLGKGLLYDNARAGSDYSDLQELYGDYTRNLARNLLRYDASIIYFDWWSSQKKRDIYQSAVVAATQRFEAVKSNYQAGDNPAIDTLESRLQLINRRIKYLEEQNNLIYKKRVVQNYYLSDNFTFEPDTSTANRTFIQNISLDSLINNAIENIPQLAIMNLKVDSLEIYRKLSVEKVKPELNLSYYNLNDLNDLSLEGVQADNYKVGINFKFNTLIRRERADLELADLKIQEAKLKLNQKTLEIRNKLSFLLERLEIINNQINLYNEAVEGFEYLLEAERLKFDIGESSLFLINQRELMLISAQLISVDLIKKKFLTLSEIRLISGY